VTRKVDSRTILREQGDRLYMMAGGRTRRVHGLFVSDTEVLCRAQPSTTTRYAHLNGPKKRRVGGSL
jgi:DNA segregation ATPase FtsK/SpoIIIE-like protein